MQACLERYAQHFGVMPSIRFPHSLEPIARDEDDVWQMRYGDAQGQQHIEVFDTIVACTGFWISFPFFDQDSSTSATRRMFCYGAR